MDVICVVEMTIHFVGNKVFEVDGVAIREENVAGLPISMRVITA